MPVVVKGLLFFSMEHLLRQNTKYISGTIEF